MTSTGGYGDGQQRLVQPTAEPSFSSLYEIAKAALERGDHSKANAALQQCLGITKDCKEKGKALFLMAKVYVAVGAFDMAALAFFSAAQHDAAIALVASSNMFDCVGKAMNLRELFAFAADGNNADRLLTAASKALAPRLAHGEEPLASCIGEHTSWLLGMIAIRAGAAQAFAVVKSQLLQQVIQMIVRDDEVDSDDEPEVQANDGMLEKLVYGERVRIPKQVSLVLFDPFVGPGKRGVVSAVLAQLKCERQLEIIAKDAVLLPGRIRIVGVAVESMSVHELNCVSPSTHGQCEGFSMIGFNVLQKECCPVMLDDHQHTLLTEPKVLLDIDVDTATKVDSKGDLATESLLEITTKGRIDGLVFWLECSYGSDLPENQVSSAPWSIAHGSTRMGSLERAHLFQHVVFSYGEGRQVECGNQLRVCSTLLEDGPSFEMRVGSSDGKNLVSRGGQKAEHRTLEYHFPMISDKARNAAFHNGIRTAVQNLLECHDKSPRVLDIGSGSGLLSLMAAKVGAGSIVALEKEKTLAELSRGIIQDNALSEKIQVVSELSRGLKADELGGDFDLVVSEIFGDAPMSEGVLQTFAHAAEKLLTKAGHFVPAKCNVVAALVYCPDLHTVFAAEEFLGFNISALNHFRPTADTWHVKTLPNLEYCTEPCVVAEFDFNKRPFPTLNYFEKVVTGSLRLPSKGLQPNAIVHWFELDFVPGAGIKMDTSPASAVTCWKQNVVFLGRDESACATMVSGSYACIRLQILVDRMIFSCSFQEQGKEDRVWIGSPEHDQFWQGGAAAAV